VVTGGVLKLPAAPNRDLLKVEEISGQNPFACYQCGKCAAGCPVAHHMDLTPVQVLRLLQLGDARVLEAESPWICASCLACSVRCPKGVDIPSLMEAIRLVALRKGIVRGPLPRWADDLPQIALVGAMRKASP